MTNAPDPTRPILDLAALADALWPLLESRIVASFPGQKGTGSPLPSPPLNLTAGSPTTSTISLNWLAPIGGALSYNVYRSGGLIASGVTLLTYTDSGLVANTSYSYYVTGVNALGEGFRSNSALGTTVPPAPTNLIVTGTTTTSASLSWSAGTVFFQENFTAYPTGNVSLTSAWTANGYSDFENSGTPSNIQILNRAGMPSGLLSDPNFPAGKTRCCFFNLAANEVIARLLWSGLSAAQRSLSLSWWEYRSGANLGGEKFCRFGNFVPNDPNNNRGIDSIITLGQLTHTTLIANSTQMHAYGDHSMSPGIGGWPPGLNHFEVVVVLSTGTNADGSVSFYQNGALIGQVTGLQFFDNLTQAAIGLQLWDMGGWSSTGGGTESPPPVVYPIDRYYCAARVANAYQGVWPMSAI